MGQTMRAATGSAPTSGHASNANRKVARGGDGESGQGRVTSTYQPERAAFRRKPGKPATRAVVQTWAFDSIGTRKYAIQIQRAANGNPCLRIVEGVPQNDGSYRKFDMTIWSEDFEQLFEALDQVRQFMAEHDIRTPDGHSYQPSKPDGARRSSRRGARNDGPGRPARTSPEHGRPRAGRAPSPRRSTQAPGRDAA